MEMQRLLETMLDTLDRKLDINEPIKKAEIEKISKRYDRAVELGYFDLSKEEIIKIKERIDNYKVKFVGEYIKVRKSTLKKVIATGAIISALGAVGVVAYNAGTKNSDLINEEIVLGEGNLLSDNTLSDNSVSDNEVAEVGKVLDPSLKFDPNDNIELVDRMSKFIANALASGVPVMDVMTEEELEIANKNNESVLTISQLMDFYMVMNIESIDPADYSRLNYDKKTTESIVDNYQYCARIFMEDSLTADDDNKVQYDTIISDILSRNSVQKFVDYLSHYNSVDSKKGITDEIKNYIISTYVDKDANIYSMSANEFVYRLMFVADGISSNTIISKDINVILNEDGKLVCSNKKDDGEKGKTEKAEEFTSITNVVKEKLEISREFSLNYVQNDENILETEKKTGYELEREIKDIVLSMGIIYTPNKKFEQTQVSTSGKTKTQQVNNSASYILLPDGAKIDTKELTKYGISSSDPLAAAKLLAAKKAEFDAAADANAIYQDNDGDALGTGLDVIQYNSGYTAGYSAGNKGYSSNPGSNNTSYVKGYNGGYEDGCIDRSLSMQNNPSTPTTNYEDTPDQGVGSETVIEEKPYTGPITPAPTTPQGDGNTTFEPESGEVNTDTSDETIEEYDFTSSTINKLEQWKRGLLAYIDDLDKETYQAISSNIGQRKM